MTSKCSGDKKRSRNSLTLNAKLEMIKLSAQGLSMAAIGRKLGLARQTVSAIVNAKEKVLKEINSATPLNTKVIRKRGGLIADMEKRLLVWMEERSGRDVPLSRALIQAEARTLFNSIKAERGEEAAEERFEASRGWFNRFKRRSQLHNTLDDEDAKDGHVSSCSGDLPAEEDCDSLVTLWSPEHHDLLSARLFDLVQSSIGVDSDLGCGVWAHRLILNVFLASEKLMSPLDEHFPTKCCLDSVLEFLYTGQVTLRRDQLANVLEVARECDFRLLVNAITSRGQQSNTNKTSTTETTSGETEGWQSVLPRPGHDAGTTWTGLGSTCSTPFKHVEESPPVPRIKLELPEGFEDKELLPDISSDIRSGPPTNHAAVKTELVEFNEEEGRTASEELDLATRHSPVESSQRQRSTKAAAYVVRRSQRWGDLGRTVVNPENFLLKRPLLHCKICGMAFPNDSTRIYHQRKHDFVTIKSHGCSECGRCFGTRHQLLAHFRIHSGEKPFECGLCGETFRVNASRALHMLSHTGERPYGCEICGKSFIRKSSHIVHLRRHTGQKPFPCDVCGKLFASSSNLGTHFKTHSNK